MNKRNKMMDALRELHRLQVNCLYADNVVMEIDTFYFTDNKRQAIYVTIRKLDINNSAEKHIFLGFHDTDSEEEITENIERVRNFINDITK